MEFDETVERATTFRPQDAPLTDRLDDSEAQRETYRRLCLANSLDWNGRWRDRKKATGKDAVAIVDAIAAHLELTDFQKSQARVWFDRLPRSYLEGNSTGAVALCLCGLAGRQDGRDYHPNRIHPNSTVEPVPANTFVYLADDIGVSYQKLSALWSRIENEVV